MADTTLPAGLPNGCWSKLQQNQRHCRSIFWIAVWATVFTLPYLYYSADLGPMTGFVYTGLCCITWTYVYFCVGEVTGRTIE